MNLDDLTIKLKSWFKEDYSATQKWRALAQEDYAFYNGEQWSERDLNALKKKRRPVITFNRIAPLINAVIGSERNNKREIRFIPRIEGTAEADEILSSASNWFIEAADAEYVNSVAFSDAVICGMGWVETRIDFENNPQGEPYAKRLDPLKMVWQCNAENANVLDAKRLWYIDRKPLSEAKEMFPNVDEADLDAGEFYNEDELESSDNQDAPKDYITLIECRWYEREPYYLTYDENGQQQELSVEEYNNLPDKAGTVKLTKNVAKRVFIGRKVLEQPDKPLAPPGSLGWECITGYIDRKHKHFYGLVRALKDPQRWANKFFSQVMHIMNSQAKGGIMAERGAFDDDRQAEESFARADNITFLSPGGKNRVMPKPSAQFPAGFFNLLEEAKNSFSAVSGLAPEFIGTREVDQAGILENTRKQSSLNLLAELFDNLQRFRRRQGLIILELLKKYLADGRLIRMVGQDKMQYMPLTAQVLSDKDYDIIIDDSPTSPNERERNFMVIQQMLPMLQQYLTPQMGLEILKYSPLPATLTDKLTQLYIQQQQEQAQQSQQPNPQEMKARGDLELTQAKASLAKAKAEAALKQAYLEEQRIIAERERTQLEAMNKGV